MDCPLCRSGPLRVLPNVSPMCQAKGDRPSCVCEHRIIICENCLTWMISKCGMPMDESKLPPEYPVDIFKGGVGPGVALTEEQQAFQRQLRVYYPTLEEFKERIKRKKKKGSTGH